MSEVEKMFRSFAAQLTAQLIEAIDAQALAQAKQAAFASLGMDATVAKRRGRPPKGAQVVAASITPIVAKARKKMPPQFCPVPSCENKAAPIFGMVCSKHKDVAKSKIKKYREDRQAKKLKAAA